MKGRADLKDARERLDGYMDVMNRYGLPVTEHMLFQGNYWRDRGNQAVEWFLSGPEKPEAIICANDFMAISVLMALKERNIRVPEDIALAGFDDIEGVEEEMRGNLIPKDVRLHHVEPLLIDFFVHTVSGGHDGENQVHGEKRQAGHDDVDARQQ